MKGVTAALAMFILIIGLSPARADERSRLGDLRLSMIEGDVQILTEDTEDWVPATTNFPLREGDRLWVPDGSRAEIQGRDGTYVRLDENSSLDVLSGGDDSFQYYQGSGRVYVNYQGRRGSMIQIDTPLSSLRALDRAVFMVDVDGEGETEVSVLKGAVTAESRSGRTRVGAGKRLVMAGDTYADLTAMGRPDSWERWNVERDKRLSERRYSSRYLPDELEGYAHDFDEYGRWVHLREYGYVWTPTVHMYAGWSPYRHGRWVWVRGDYVWIGHEPWGWAPYHYGRWTFVVSVGWCWVPPARGAVYWGPGFVGWVDTPTYVAWVPLAPYETYYGYGHYGPHSVNIVNINIQKTVVKKVYKNVHVHNGVTVVQRDAFVKGAPVPVYEPGNRRRIFSEGNPFLKERISVGRPHIKPEKRTIMPVVRDVQPSKRPPERIRKMEVKKIREERPFVRNPERSVFRKETEEKREPGKGNGEMRRTQDRPDRGDRRIEDAEAPARPPRKHGDERGHQWDQGGRGEREKSVEDRSGVPGRREMKEKKPEVRRNAEEPKIERRREREIREKGDPRDTGDRKGPKNNGKHRRPEKEEEAVPAFEGQQHPQDMPGRPMSPDRATGEMGGMNERLKGRGERGSAAGGY